MKSGFSSRRHQRGAAASWVFGGFALVALFFLLTEHRAHLYGWLPYLLLAACPLMHLLHGHGGHGGHRRHGAPPRRDPADPAPPAAHHHH
jgi:peptidoglycan/LPS O-acetylase OafA/YrhL